MNNISIKPSGQNSSQKSMHEKNCDYEVGQLELLQNVSITHYKAA